MSSRRGGRAVRAKAFALAALTLLVVLGIDQATKALAVSSLVPGDSVNVFFGIDLSLVRNRGIAFGALAGAGGTVIAALVAVALIALIAFFAARAERPLLWLPVGAVLGGAAGNLLDRARLGSVVDFIDPTFWPAFNLADTAIVLGVLGVLYVAEGATAGEEGVEEGPPDAAPSRLRSDGAGEGARRSSASWPESS